MLMRLMSYSVRLLLQDMGSECIIIAQHSGTQVQQ